jgi:5-methylcytosine-specific restriction endonuclease McrA
MSYFSSGPRKRGSDHRGQQFSDSVRRAVWQKARTVPGYDPMWFRVDMCGAYIRWELYGDTTPGGAGWEIDHIRPVSQGGGDELGNLQPLQWENNRAKGDDYPEWYCHIRRAA